MVPCGASGKGRWKVQLAENGICKDVDLVFCRCSMHTSYYGVSRDSVLATSVEANKLNFLKCLPLYDYKLTATQFQHSKNSVIPGSLDSSFPIKNFMFVL